MFYGCEPGANVDPDLTDRSVVCRHIGDIFPRTDLPFRRQS